MTGVVAPAERWELLRGEVKGAAKKYSQDRCAARQVADGRAVVLAVADGHGSAPHFRSDLGARWAVEEFAVCAEEFALSAVRHDDAEPHAAEDTWWQGLGELRACARRLPQLVAHRWYERATLHDCNSPAHGTPRHTPKGPEHPSKGPDLTAYGTTLVGAVLTRRLLVCWQLGDGDVVVLDAAGTPYTPLYTGPDLGDETDSLCAPESWHRARCHWQPLTSEGPSGVLLSTDGLSKSFTDHQGFLDFAAGVQGRAHELGMPAVRSRLPEWLSRAAQYSGDDTTLVGAFEAEGHAAPRQNDAPHT
ncbi:protein phosphatase 2C domain-containing protein [Streptomyces sp. NBC_00588]|uniref:protein phosphatase 2C domain-containing protein n=1 Tax=Streptomyces sp. NBC_00588 TaxID=2975784 RepID=UPI002E80EA99|nr:protein phosphatase 2C domain-containing protein [Streptomyces sp. NBC_00588]WUB35231.1 protein phosphatase 2C domain-containing protein [Streptomyces sp. NBC_00588]